MDAKNDVLGARSKTHGDFIDNAEYSSGILRIMQSSKNWDNMPDAHQHALAMLSCKLGRILAGDFKFEDHWVDIAGYATLVANSIAERR